MVPLPSLADRARRLKPSRRPLLSSSPGTTSTAASPRLSAPLCTSERRACDTNAAALTAPSIDAQESDSATTIVRRIFGRSQKGYLVAFSQNGEDSRDCSAFTFRSVVVSLSLEGRHGMAGALSSRLGTARVYRIAPALRYYGRSCTSHRFASKPILAEHCVHLTVHPNRSSLRHDPSDGSLDQARTADHERQLTDNRSKAPAQELDVPSTSVSGRTKSLRVQWRRWSLHRRLA